MGSAKPRERGLSAALFGKTRRAVLALLLGRPDDALYLRQIVRAVRCGQGGVQRELKRLTEAGIIQRVARDRRVVYQANRECPALRSLRELVTQPLVAAGPPRAPVPEARGRPTIPPRPALPAGGTRRDRSTYAKPAAERAVAARRARPRATAWVERIPTELL